MREDTVHLLPETPRTRRGFSDESGGEVRGSRPEIDWLGRRTIRDLIDERVARHPNKPCLIIEYANGSVREFSYAQFRTRARRVAAGLQSLGIGKGDRVVIFLPNTAEFIFAWFGAVWLGAVAVPANIANTSSEMDYVVGFSGSTVVITSAKYRAIIDELNPSLTDVRHRFTIDEHGVPGWKHFDELQGAEEDLIEPEISDDDVAQFVFTSGTTSKPKAVMLTHANCLHSGVRGAHSAGVGSDDRLLSSLPAFHVNAQSFTVFAALEVGATFILLEQYSASKFISQVHAYGATTLSLVAMQVRTLLAQPPSVRDRDHRATRSIFALKITTEEYKGFQDRFGITLLNGYGLSEAMTGVSGAPFHGEPRWPSIGVPAIGLTVRLLNEEGDDVTTGVPGEIAVGGVPGRTIMKGYFQDSAATVKAIRDGWLRTGDLAYADEYGYLYFVDRLKDVIKRAGENISASEVEAVLLMHPAVAEAAVIGVPDPIRDEAVKAIVVLNEGQIVTAEELIVHCQRNLAAFKVPSFVEFREHLPKTSIGKIEKKLLREEESSRGQT